MEQPVKKDRTYSFWKLIYLKNALSNLKESVNYYNFTKTMFFYTYYLFIIIFRANFVSMMRYKVVVSVIRNIFLSIRVKEKKSKQFDL